MSRISLTRFLVEEQHAGRISADLRQLIAIVARACNMISITVGKGALGGVLGDAGTGNIQGEVQKKLDVISNDILLEANAWGGHLAACASEEMDHSSPMPPEYPHGDFLLLYDPLDGSSNIDVNVSVGTIFSIHRKVSDHPRGCIEDCLQVGRRQVAAGYVVYGSSTMLVYTTGHGVHGFTLDPSIGEFLLSHPNMRIPAPGQRIYSVNEGNYLNWSEGQRRFIDHLKGLDGENDRPFSSRYVGSMVADVHRTLLYGGIFMYPADRKNTNGKLRLLYECAPIAMIMEAAGGRASTGAMDILDVEPTSLHQRVPLYVGSKEYVDLAERFLKEEVAVAV